MAIGFETGRPGAPYAEWNVVVSPLTLVPNFRSMIQLNLPAACLALVALSGCSAATASQPGPAQPAPATRPAASPADTRFITDMIGHHAQAIRIAAWAPGHGASPAVQRMAERVVVGQNDEIAIMQRWLRERGLPVPAADTMPGSVDHSQHMPGMLSPAQLAELDSARGAAFDRLFLTRMIMHHQGALTMVDQLFGSQNAAQDETVFRLASDVYADQSTEIDRMQKMLDALPPEGSHQ